MSPHDVWKGYGGFERCSKCHITRPIQALSSEDKEGKSWTCKNTAECSADKLQLQKQNAEEPLNALETYPMKVH